MGHTRCTESFVLALLRQQQVELEIQYIFWRLLFKLVILYDPQIIINIQMPLAEKRFITPVTEDWGHGDMQDKAQTSDVRDLPIYSESQNPPAHEATQEPRETITRTQSGRAGTTRSCQSLTTANATMRWLNLAACRILGTQKLGVSPQCTPALLGTGAITPFLDINVALDRY